MCSKKVWIRERKKKGEVLRIAQKGPISALFVCEAAISSFTALSCMPSRVPVKRERPSLLKEQTSLVYSAPMKKAMLEKVDC